MTRMLFFQGLMLGFSKKSSIMKERSVYLLTLLFFVLSTAHGQHKVFIKNAKIKFNVFRTSFEFIDTIQVILPKYFIRVDLNGKQRKEVKTLTKDDWMNFLNDNRFDWAANLLLYDMYERDAFLFFGGIKNKERWRLSQKEADIQYWSQYLK